MIVLIAALLAATVVLIVLFSASAKRKGKVSRNYTPAAERQVIEPEPETDAVEENNDITINRTIAPIADEPSDSQQSIDEKNENEKTGSTDICSESIVQSMPATIPEYNGEDYITLNNDIPMFSQYDMESIRGESYSELDSLGRCGPAIAMLDKSMMPTEERGSIGMIQPSGWHTIKYPDLIGDLYLYNRCHLIGYALTGQNANELNLITGTRYFNVSIMLIFENEVARILRDTDNHVLYRVSPLFLEDELVARGVEMEALSVEDKGESLKYHVFCYNIQPGIGIDYRTGDSWVVE